MAASITGTFTIIDRASGPMRKMEAQAAKTMAAIEGVGKAQDLQGGKSSKSAKALAQEEKALKAVEGRSKATGKALKDLGNDTDRTDKKVQSLAQRLTKLGGVFAGLRGLMKVGMFTGLAVAITTLVQAVGVLAGGLTALIPMLVQTTGAFAAIPGAIGAAVQGFAGMKLALGGVGEALKAGITLQQQSGQTATQMANQHRQAAEAIRSANHGVEMAARGVSDAEWNVQLAQRSSFDAQRALNDARLEATRQMQDMKAATQSAALGEQRAALSLRQAKLSLSQQAINPASTSLDMMDANLAVREAQLNLRQQQRDANRSQQDLKIANRRGGASGTAGMISARRGMVDAARGQQQAALGVTDALYEQQSATMALVDAQRANAQAARQGTSSQNALKQAMKQLSPEAQSFVKSLIAMRPAFMDLRDAAGKDLFPRLERGFQNLTKWGPMLKRVFRGTGRVMGDAFEGLTERLTTGSRIGDLGDLGKTNNQMLARMGRALGNVVEGFIDLTIAAKPLTTWLSKLIEQWTQSFQTSMAVGRSTGTLATYFDKTRTALEQFGRILGNTWDVLKLIGQYATPLGQRLWDGAEQATEGWKAFLESTTGAQKVTGWFNDLYEPLHALGQLTKELAIAWAHISVNPSFTDTVNELTRATPYLERMLNGVSGLGPSVARLLTQIVRLLSNLPFNALTMFLDALTGVLKIVNGLIEKFPILGDVLSGVLAASFGVKALGLIGTFGGKLLGLVGIFKKVRDAAAVSGIVSAFTGGGVPIPGGKGKVPTPTSGGGLKGAIVRGAEGAAAWAGSTYLGRKAISAGRTIFGTRGYTGFQGYGEPVMPEGKPGILGRIGWKGALGIDPMVGASTAARLGSRFIPGVGWGSLAAEGLGATGLVSDETSKNMNPLGFLDPSSAGGDFGPQVEALTNMFKYKVGDWINEGDVKAIREFAGQLSTASVENGADALSNDWVNAINDAKQAAQQTKIFEPVEKKLGRLTDVSKKNINQFAIQMDKMTPEARNAALKALTAQAQTLEKQGYLPEGAAADVRDGILGKWDDMDKRAGKKFGKLMDSITGAIKRKLPDVAKQAENVAGIFGSSTFAGIFGAVGALGKKNPGLGEGLMSIINGPTANQYIQKIAGSKRETIALQRRSGLTADGVFGQDTAAAALAEAKKKGLEFSPERVKAEEKGRRQLEDGQDKHVEATKRKLEKLRDITKDLTDAAAEITQGNQNDTEDKVGRSNDRIVGGNKTSWQRVFDIISNNTDRARDTAKTNFNTMVEDGIKALISMGMSRGEATDAASGKTGKTGTKGHGGKGGVGLAFGGRVNFAGGGRLGGVGLSDNVQIAPGHMAAPGELVVNRHTEQRINQKLGGKTTLGAEVAGEGRPHYAKMKQIGGVEQKRHKKGGTVWGDHLNFALGPYDIPPIAYAADHAGSNSHVHVTMDTPDWAVKFGEFMRSKGWEVGENALLGDPPLPGVHSATGGHYDGTAFDANTAEDETQQQVAQVAAWLNGGSAGAIGVGGAATGGMGPFKGIKMPPLARGGLPAAMTNQLTKNVRAAMNKKLGAAAGSAGGAGSAANVPTGPVQAMAHQMVSQIWGEGQWSAFNSLEMSEAGWDPKALNASSGAAGLAQALPASKYPAGAWPYTGPESAKLQLGWMMDYIKDRYGTPSAAWAFHQANNWYDKGGRLGGQMQKATMGGRAMEWGGWKRNGFSGTVDGPTVFGAGEAGKEHVRITPDGKGAAGGVGRIDVRIDHIDYHGEGDIAKAVEKEFAKVADDLALIGMND